jgi:hypothetical protein
MVAPPHGFVQVCAGLLHPPLPAPLDCFMKTMTFGSRKSAIDQIIDSRTLSMDNAYGFLRF